MTTLLRSDHKVKITTRNLSGDEMANVNFSRRHLTTFTQCALEATEFGEIPQNKGHYAVQSHSRSPILVPIESSYRPSLRLPSDILRTSYLAPFPTYSLRWVQNRCIWLPLLGLTPSTEGFPVSYHRMIVSDMSLKTRCFGLHFCRTKFTYIFNHFYTVHPAELPK